MNNAEGVYRLLSSPSLYSAPSDLSQGMWCLENRRQHLGSFGRLGQPLFMKRCYQHGYFRRLGKTIFSAHFTTFSARTTALRCSFLVTGSAGPGYRVSTAYAVKLSAFQK